MLAGADTDRGARGGIGLALSVAHADQVTLEPSEGGEKSKRHLTHETDQLVDHCPESQPDPAPW